MPLRAEQNDIIIAGAGPTGLIVALALSVAGFKVRLIGPKAEKKNDLTTALMTPAIKMLQQLEIGNSIFEESTPLKTMRIADATNFLIASPTVTFHAHEMGEKWFGLNIPNNKLNEALETEVKKRVPWTKATVDEWIIKPEKIVAKTKEGLFSGRLGIAADGKESKTRKAANILMNLTSCKQTALILSFYHTQPHDYTSTEFHTNSGPFTQTPLPRQHSALVWVTSPEQAKELYNMKKKDLEYLIERKMNSILGQLTIGASRALHPIFKGIANRFAQNRIALIGEAAHTLPPIGAQGLNLGIRDIKHLVKLISENKDDPGSESVLESYDSKRRCDIQIRSGVVNSLNNLLLSNRFGTQVLRGSGLALLANIPALRIFLMKEGLEPGQGLQKQSH